ncbi:4'-phosphopantetheinyl transferase superfamily protein [Streptomyces lavendulocolor]|uniref:4'-phosphopantetheinyl transferase family protein n=1 Tax=Streptomyces lavendulocolor TaxID=67316 RepID=UPI003C2CF969
MSDARAARFRPGGGPEARPAGGAAGPVAAGDVAGSTGPVDPVVRLWRPAPGIVLALARSDRVLAAPRVLDRLRPEERRAAAGMPPWRAAEHLAGRALVRHLLAGLLGEEGARGPVVPEPGGRPRLPGSPGTGISVSHSGPYAVAAVGAGADVGVDVQVPVPPSPRMLRRCCAPRTAARLTAMEPGPAALAFARVWAVQEACVKARGTGLAGAPWRVPADPDAPAGAWGSLRWCRLPRPAGAGPEPAALACAFGPPEPAGPSRTTAPAVAHSPRATGPFPTAPTAPDAATPVPTATTDRA